jgi:hypothetical protein
MFIDSIFTKENLNINKASYKEIAGPTEEVMVYGFEHCKYKEVISILKNHGIFKKVDKWDDFDKTLEGRDVSLVLLKSAAADLFKSIFNSGPLAGAKDWFAVRCKESLLNICVENYQRSLESRPLIPVIYCVDIENNPYPFEAKNVASEDPILNGLITHKELRLCYKVVNEMQNDKLKEVFKETLKFVKLTPFDRKEYKLETMAPFWEQSDWKEAWEKRKLNKKNRMPHSNWKEKLIGQIQKIDDRFLA